MSNSPLIVDKQILDSLLTTSSEAVIFYDQEFNILIFNKAAETLFSLKFEEVIGQQFSLEKARQSSKILASVMFPSLAPTVIRQSPEGVYPQVIDVILEEPHQELRLFLNKVVDEQNQVLGFVKIIHDQTRERGLLQSQRDFITVVAHQLRTPSTATAWAFENLSKDQTISKESQDIINIGFAAAKNLTKIINDLLNIAQIEEGKFSYQFQDLNLLGFIEKLLASAEPIAKEYKVKVYLDKPATEVIVSIDAVKLSIAVSNLIDNAIKYNTLNGEVTVKVDLVEDGGKKFAQVGIKDTGIGIVQEEIDKLFAKFFRGTNASKIAVAGSGLGLYITKNVIEHHGGKIWVESFLGRGTTFYFTLPLK